MSAEPAFTIAYEDEHLLVVDKGPALVVHPARGHREGTLSQLLADAAAGGDPERAGIVHRLDRDTSGLLVVSRSEEAHRLLQAALAQRLIEREYLALVQGRPPARTGTIEAPIGRDAARPHAHDRGRRPSARGPYALHARPRARSTSLLRLRLDTGRTHQIRVHLQAIGHPVVRRPRVRRRPACSGLKRQFLHATRLAFPHPLTGEPIEVRSPLPADLRHALALAEQRLS